MEIFIYKSEIFNPYINLATEEYFFRYVTKNQNMAVLYFWQNSDTIVIGRNQDATAECDLNKLKNTKTFLARRKTGGGAVFHDKNNLNFSFIVPKKFYDKQKSMEIIKNAMRNLNLDAEITGRNDIVINGKKFSGNAYYNAENACLHHGTILIDTDFEKLSKLLTPDKSKLQKKGVNSVKSRVLNLKEIKSDISVDTIEIEIKKEFEKLYNATTKVLELTNFDIKKIEEIEKTYSDKNWTVGKVLDIIKNISENFDWGTCTIKYLKSGECKIFSDCLYPELIEQCESIINRNENNPTKNPIINDILELHEKRCE